jgi:putative ABC transport system permease protein
MAILSRIHLRLATQGVLQQRRRLAVLGTGIVSVTCLITLMDGVDGGIRGTLVNTATALFSGHLNVGGFYKPTTRGASAVLRDAQRIEALVAPTIPEVASIVERGRGTAYVVSGRGGFEATLAGIEPTSEAALQAVLKVDDQAWRRLARPGTVLLFEGDAARLGGVKVGDTVTLSTRTPRGTANTVDCEVVAVAGEIGRLSRSLVYLPAQTWRQLFDLPEDATGALHVYLLGPHGRDLSQLAASLRTTLTAAGYRMMEPDPRPFARKFASVARELWTGQKVDISTWETELSFVLWTLRFLVAVGSILTLVLMVILAVGIANTTWIAVRERTREIGTLRALGMQRRDILVVFMLESLILGALGALAGTLLGVAIAAGLNTLGLPVPAAVQLFLMASELRLAVAPGHLARIIALVAVVAAAAAYVPARRASRLRPVTAMGFD